jgi:hypothetical protein
VSDPKSFQLPPQVHEYLVAHGTPPDALQRELIEETQRLGGISLMQIAPEQGAFMTLLTRAIGARRAVEVGTFTGYSAICIARGLPEDGQPAWPRGSSSVSDPAPRRSRAFPSTTRSTSRSSTPTSRVTRCTTRRS